MTPQAFAHERLDVYRLSIEYVSAQDVLVVSDGLEDAASRDMKLKLKRVVSMLTRMAMKFDGVSESRVDNAVAIDYEHEHRDAEHEHGKREPEPGRAPKDGLRGYTNGKSIVRPR